MIRHAVAMALLIIPHGAQAQTYPTRTIRLVVASSPGGSSDILGRMIAQKISEPLGQQIVIDNRAGASGVIGVDMVAKAAPDGYTLLISQTSLAINPAMIKKLPYEALRDFAPVSQLVVGPNVLTVHPSVPAKTVKECIALAKARPGSLIIGSPGVGTSPHLSAELFKFMAGVDMPQAPYRGAGMAIISLLAGEIPAMFPTPPTAIQYFKAKRLRALGVTTKIRIHALPDVPPISDTIPGYEATQWFGILAPAGTPRPIVDRLNQEIVRALRAPDIVERMNSEGMAIVGDTPEQFAAHMKSETEKWAKVISAAGIKPE